eukprot:scaffold2560_cov397-Prasinococcus_capsulatus_cf.AAC.11
MSIELVALLRRLFAEARIWVLAIAATAAPYGSEREGHSAFRPGDLLPLHIVRPPVGNVVLWRSSNRSPPPNACLSAAASHPCAGLSTHHPSETGLACHDEQGACWHK